VVAESVKMPTTDASGKPIPAVGTGGVANSIAFTLREMLQKEIRVTVLGHAQRGGSPTTFDRILGTRFGVAFTDLVANGQFAAWSASRLVKWHQYPLTRHSNK